MKNIKNILFLIILWMIVVVLINPQGEFPFSDDFAYAGPVQKMLDSGTMQISDWTSMTLVGHIWIGTFVASLFGFSFTVLRFAELIFALASIIAVFYLSKEIIGNDKKSMVIAVLFMFNPDFLLNTFGFMTDITFYFFFICSILFLAKYIKNEKIIYFLLGLLFSMYALLIRDLALIVPASFFIAIIYKYGIKLRYIFIAVLFVTLMFAEYQIFRYWFVNVHGLTQSMDFSRNRIMDMLTNPLTLIKTTSRNFVYISFYLGFYLFPVILPVFVSVLKEKSILHKRIIAAGLIALGIFGAAYPLISSDFALLMKNILTTNQLLHTYVIPDVHNPSRELVQFNPSWLMAFMTSISLIGSASFWYILFAGIKNYIRTRGLFKYSSDRGPIELITLIFASYFGLILTQMFFTRYQIQIFAVLAIILALLLKADIPKKRIIYSISTIVFIFIIFSSLTATRDMMEFSRTRSKALDFLTTELKVAPKKIDGGFEFNAWHFYDWNYKKTPYKNWWWVQDDEYVVTWGKITGYDLIKEFHYIRWNPPCQNSKVYVFKRLDNENTNN